VNTQNIKDQCTTHFCTRYSTTYCYEFYFSVMKFVKSNHCATLKNEHLGELIRTSNNALSRFSGTRKSNNNLILTITIHYFNVKPGFFTVFVLTLQTGFAARRCFWLSANDSSIEQGCPPWFVLYVKKTGPSLGAQGDRSPPWKIFCLPWKNVLDKI